MTGINSRYNLIVLMETKKQNHNLKVICDGNFLTARATATTFCVMGPTQLQEK